MSTKKKIGIAFLILIGTILFLCGGLAVLGRFLPQRVSKSDIAVVLQENGFIRSPKLDQSFGAREAWINGYLTVAIGNIDLMLNHPIKTNNETRALMFTMITKLYGQGLANSIATGMITQYPNGKGTYNDLTWFYAPYPIDQLITITIAPLPKK